MHWIILVVAGLFEVGWAVGLTYTEGFTRLWPSVGTVVSMVISLGLLAVAMKSLPVGTAYAVWVGIGMVGAIIAGLFEVGWALGLKYTEGFTKFWPSVFTIAAIVISMGLLGLAMRTLPVGTAYAVWTGIGIVGTAIAGVFLLGEPVSAVRVVSILLILTGIAGLKLSASA